MLIWNYLSFCSISPWIQSVGNPFPLKILLSAFALSLDFMKIMTWLNCRASSKSATFLFFWSSFSLTKYYFNPCKTSLSSFIKTSKGFYMSLFAIAFMLSFMVAENIMTCLSWGVSMKMLVMSFCISNVSFVDYLICQAVCHTHPVWSAWVCLTSKTSFWWGLRFFRGFQQWLLEDSCSEA